MPQESKSDMITDMKVLNSSHTIVVCRCFLSSRSTNYYNEIHTAIICGQGSYD